MIIVGDHYSFIYLQSVIETDTLKIVSFGDGFLGESTATSEYEVPEKLSFVHLAILILFPSPKLIQSYG